MNNNLNDVPISQNQDLDKTFLKDEHNNSKENEQDNSISKAALISYLLS